MLLPFYGVTVALLLTPLRGMPDSSIASIISVTFIITCIVPALGVLILYKSGYVSDPGLNRQDDRFVPYLITLLCYAGQVVYLEYIGAPQWMYMFMVGASVAVIISTVVNFWWKISGHMAGIGGLTGLVLRMSVSHIAIYDMFPYVIAALMLSGILGSCRIALRCHTPSQVLAGWINGFVWVFLLA